MSNKKAKRSKRLFSKKKLKRDFTCPTPRHMMPEDITIGSIHISKRPNNDGLHTVYDSSTNTMVMWSRASIAAFSMAINAGEHHEALHIES